MKKIKKQQPKLIEKTNPQVIQEHALKAKNNLDKKQ